MLMGARTLTTRPLEGLGRQASWIGRRAETFLFDIDNTLTHGEDAHLWPLPEDIRIKAGAKTIEPVPTQRRFIPDEDNILVPGQNWDRWNEARRNAAPNHLTLDLLHKIRGSGYNLMGLTARTTEADDITRQWLTKHGLGDVPFVSRSLQRGEESSKISKGWAVDKLRSQGVNPIAGIEDSIDNIKMFGERGIPHALVEGGKIKEIPHTMPQEIKHLMHQHRMSSARQEMLMQRRIRDPRQLLKGDNMRNLF